MLPFQHFVSSEDKNYRLDGIAAENWFTPRRAPGKRLTRKCNTAQLKTIERKITSQTETRVDFRYNLLSFSDSMYWFYTPACFIIYTNGPRHYIQSRMKGMMLRFRIYMDQLLERPHDEGFDDWLGSFPNHRGLQGFSGQQRWLLTNNKVLVDLLDKKYVQRNLRLTTWRT